MNYSKLKIRQYIDILKLKKSVKETDPQLRKLELEYLFIHYFFGHTRSHLESLSIGDYEKIVSKVSFLHDDPPAVLKDITIDKVKYSPLTDVSKFSTNRLLSLIEYNKSECLDINKALTLIYKSSDKIDIIDEQGNFADDPLSEVYKLNEKFLEVSCDALGAVFFYAKVWENLYPDLLDCVKKQEAILEKHLQEISCTTTDGTLQSA